MENSESKFHAVQFQHGFRNDLGEMTETALFAHVQVRLGFDMNRANDFMSELEKNASVTLYSEDGQVGSPAYGVIPHACVPVAKNWRCRP